jgi:hypothetical protein
VGVAKRRDNRYALLGIVNVDITVEVVMQRVTLSVVAEVI